MGRQDDDGLDTPRTALMDNTYMSRAHDFDMSIEPSFHSPNKGANLLDQLRNGRAGGINLRTPRGTGAAGPSSSRAPLNDVQNLPVGLGGPEFTPLLKSATRNSNSRRFGKENGSRSASAGTPGMGRADESMTPVPVAADQSLYSKSGASYVDTTHYPEVDDSSTASTPLAMPTRRGGGDGKGPLSDGNQLSLREQENVIDKIEKENFGLKLKIHFLEEALRKAGPGFSEAALRENTELKVDKVTLQREIHKYKKHLSNAEKDIEDYRQQMLGMHDKMKRKDVGEEGRVEMERLKRVLEDREADIEDMQRELEMKAREGDKAEKLQDDLDDLEADMRRKEEVIHGHEDEVDDLRVKLKQAEDKVADAGAREGDIEDLEDELRGKDKTIRERDDELDGLRNRLETMESRMKDSQRKMLDLEDKAAAADKLDEAKDTIADLETDVRALEDQVEDFKEKLADAAAEKDRAENDLEELQEEMGNKSLVTKGLSRQVEEKFVRLQDELEVARDECAGLEHQIEDKQRESQGLKAKVRALQEERDAAQHETRALVVEVEGLKDDLQTRADDQALLRNRYDALVSETANMQRDVDRLEKNVSDLEEALDQERAHSLEIERGLRAQFRDELQKLQDEVSDLQAELREKEGLRDREAGNWADEKGRLEAEKRTVEDRAAGLQRTVDMLKEKEGSLSGREMRLQELLDAEGERHRDEVAANATAVEGLRRELEGRLGVLMDAKKEVSGLREELRVARVEGQSQIGKVEALEDEVDVLQAALEDSDSVQRDFLAAKQECVALKQQLKTARTEADIVKASKISSVEAARQTGDALERLQKELEESGDALAAVTREREGLEDQLVVVRGELSNTRKALVERERERDGLADEVRRGAVVGAEETGRIDTERIEMRSARGRLEGELRRVKEENKGLEEGRKRVEKLLEEEIEKAGEEEEKLADQIWELQGKVRELEAQVQQGASSSAATDSQELSAAKKRVRELERRVRDMEGELATALAAAGNTTGLEANNSEVSLIKRDLSASRKREMDLAARDAKHRDVVKGLKKQVSELERRAYEVELDKLMGSPGPDGGFSSADVASATKQEIGELRAQLSAARRELNEAKGRVRETERRARDERAELEGRVGELEGVRVELEDRVAEVEREGGVKFEREVRRLKNRVEEAERELLEQQERFEHEQQQQQQDRHKGGAGKAAAAGDDTMTMTMDLTTPNLGKSERRELYEMLRQAQQETDRLRKESHHYRTEIDALTTSDSTLRRKLERARGERAMYRVGSEKLSRDLRKMKLRVEEAEDGAATLEQELEEQILGLQRELEEREARAERERMEREREQGRVDTEAIVRAAEQAEWRHGKEVRGLALQMEWMQARWEREVGLRGDVAYAKRFVQLQLDVAEACNKADLRILTKIHHDLGLPPPSTPSPAKSAILPSSHPHHPSNPSSSSSKHNPSSSSATKPKRTLRTLALSLRFIARISLAAKRWQKHEKVRQRLEEKVVEMRRTERAKRLRRGFREGAAGAATPGSGEAAS